MNEDIFLEKVSLIITGMYSKSPNDIVRLSVNHPCIIEKSLPLSIMVSNNQYLFVYHISYDCLPVFIFSNSGIVKKINSINKKTEIRKLCLELWDYYLRSGGYFDIE
jgi:hypothetical protein